jgi:hypothetical protein
MQKHFHKTEDGTLIKCYHSCKNTICSISFWIGLTLGYPLEHFLWEKVFPFYYITEFIQTY